MAVLKAAWYADNTEYLSTWNTISDPCMGWKGVTCVSGSITALYFEGYWTGSWVNVVGTLPTAIGSLTRLSTFYLAHGHISGTIPTELSLLSSTLTYINLGTNSLSGTVRGGAWVCACPEGHNRRSYRSESTPRPASSPPMTPLSLSRSLAGAV